jgi:thiamine-phosphate pyrophosphorylase
MPTPSTRVYLISPPRIDGGFYGALERTLATGLVRMFQLRLKDALPSDVLRHAAVCASVCRRYGVPFLLNDDVEAALECGADGVHLGEEDGGAAEARARLGAGKILGISCYDSIFRAEQAVREGADYVSFGAFFPTKTKAAKASPPLDILSRRKSARGAPCCAIGGVTDANIGALIRHGADMAAVVSYVWEHPLSPEEAVRRLHANAAATDR